MRQVCSEARCPDPVVYRGRCQRHSRQRERTINRPGKQVYNSKRWRILRRRKLFNDPICERCGNELAVDVHHRHGVENDPWSLDGLEALCKPCHGKVTRAEMATR